MVAYFGWTSVQHQHIAKICFFWPTSGGIYQEQVDCFCGYYGELMGSNIGNINLYVLKTWIIYIYIYVILYIYIYYATVIIWYLIASENGGVNPTLINSQVNRETWWAPLDFGAISAWKMGSRMVPFFAMHNRNINTNNEINKKQLNIRTTTTSTHTHIYIYIYITCPSIPVSPIFYGTHLEEIRQS